MLPLVPGGGILGYSAGTLTKLGADTGLMGLKVDAMDVTSGLWFAIVDGGDFGDMVSVYSAAMETTYSVRANKSDMGPKGDLRDILGGTDSVWVAGDQGLNRFTASGEGDERAWAWELIGSEQLPDIDVYGLHRDALNRIWVFTATGLFGMWMEWLTRPLISYPT